MSLYRRAPRRDRNEREVIDALAAMGAAVLPLSGAGVPDLLVAYRTRLYLLEVKVSRGTLTEAQEATVASLGHVGVQVHVVRTAEDALKAIGAIHP